jgi:hypothetical protein
LLFVRAGLWQGLVQTLQKLTGAPTFIAADGTVDEDAMLEYFRNKDDSLTSLPAKWTFFALSYGIADWRVRVTGGGGSGTSSMPMAASA